MGWMTSFKSNIVCKLKSHEASVFSNLGDLIEIDKDHCEIVGALLGMLRFYLNFVNVNKINNPIDVDVLETVKLFQAPTCLVHQHARFRKFRDVLCLLF